MVSRESDEVSDLTELSSKMAYLAAPAYCVEWPEARRDWRGCGEAGAEVPIRPSEQTDWNSKLLGYLQLTGPPFLRSRN